MRRQFIRLPGPGGPDPFESGRAAWSASSLVSSVLTRFEGIASGKTTKTPCPYRFCLITVWQVSGARQVGQVVGYVANRSPVRPLRDQTGAAPDLAQARFMLGRSLCRRY